MDKMRKIINCIGTFNLIRFVLRLFTTDSPTNRVIRIFTYNAFSTARLTLKNTNYRARKLLQTSPIESIFLGRFFSTVKLYFIYFFSRHPHNDARDTFGRFVQNFFVRWKSDVWYRQVETVSGTPIEKLALQNNTRRKISRIWRVFFLYFLIPRVDYGV